MKATLIHNPDAGDDKQATVGQIEALLKEAGYKVRYQSSKEKGWHRVLKKSADVIVVAAGDGTVSKVARRMIGKDIPIAVLPMGTANNISKTLGIADMPITWLIRSWKTARHLEFDAGLAAGPWGERYFIEGMGAGLLTSSIRKVKRNKTMPQLMEAGVKVTYAQQIFREHLEESPAVDVEATLDGEDISGRYVLFEVLNMKYIGPNLFLAPEVERNDGEFEVVLAAEKHRQRLHNHIKHWQEGKPRPPTFGSHHGSRLQVEWTGFPIHIDDRILPKQGKRKQKARETIDIEVVPKAVTFLVPKDVHELQKVAAKNSKTKERKRRAK
jgi:diacylglycerol kinase family enzyme